MSDVPLNVQINDRQPVGISSPADMKVSEFPSQLTRSLALPSANTGYDWIVRDKRTGRTLVSDQTLQEKGISGLRLRIHIDSEKTAEIEISKGATAASLIKELLGTAANIEQWKLNDKDTGENLDLLRVPAHIRDSCGREGKSPLRAATDYFLALSYRSPRASLIRPQDNVQTHRTSRYASTCLT